MKLKTWIVKFELYGKKMKTEVQADSQYTAQLKIKDKIVFHEIVEKSADPFSFLKSDFFKNAF